MWTPFLCLTGYAADLDVGPGLAYETLVSAVAAANAGDRLVVAAGVYPEPRILIEQDLEIVGTSGTVIVPAAIQGSQFKILGAQLTLHDVTLDGLGLARGIEVVNGGLSAEGVVITNGFAELGAGINATDATIAFRQGTLSDNAATVGADVYAQRSQVSIVDAQLLGGQATDGGSIYGFGGSLEVANSQFLGGGATSGGMITAVVSDQVTLVNDTFRDFDRDVRSIVFADASPLTIRAGHFSENQPDFTAIHAKDCPEVEINGLSMVNNASEDSLFYFENNGVVRVGTTLICGNVGVRVGKVFGGTATLTNSVFLNNDLTAYGIEVWGGGGVLDATNNHFVSNTSPSAGSAVIVQSGARFEGLNNLVAYNTNPSGGAIHGNSGSTVSSDYSLYHDNASLDIFPIALNVSNTLQDPLFDPPASSSCDPIDVFPPIGSPVVNAGSPYLADLDGSRSDIGAFGGPAPFDPFQTDADGDGFASGLDCDDMDSQVRPYGVEIPCDGLDNDCDPETADVVDLDGDGAHCDVDCLDSDPTTHPGALEVCDAVDNDCNGLVDDDPTDGMALYEDRDADGFGDLASVGCAATPSLTATGGDCDDDDPAVFPGGIEAVDDGIDQDCDGVDLTSRLDGGVGCRLGPGGPPWLALVGISLLIPRRPRSRRDGSSPDSRRPRRWRPVA